MRTAGNKAFTMVELLMVILIISILVTLAIPSVFRAIELARQAACNTNVKVIVQGLAQCSGASEEIPYIPMALVSSWNTTIGDNRGSNPFATGAGAMARNHSANLWLLIREDQVAMDAFVCPSTDDIAKKDEKVKNYWDFKSGARISYGLQSPYGYDGSLNSLPPPGVVLVADGSPYVTTSGVIHPDWDGAAADTMTLSSPNHTFEGQNVGFWDGHVKWETTPTCGKEGDNIYTASNSVTETSATGSLTPTVRNNENDTLILP